MAKRRSTAAAPAPALHRYRSPNIPLGAIRHYARQIAAHFQPQKIILFGSYAYGKPHEHSDVDLLVVMPARNQVSQAVRIRWALPAPFAMDLIVRTPERLRRALDEEDWFLREIVENGKLLYEKKNRPMGPEGRIGQRSRTGARQQGGCKTWRLGYASPLAV